MSQIATLSLGDLLMTGKIINRISEVAGKRRMQISDIANKADLPYMTVKRQWYATAGSITFSTLAAICQALDCQPGDLLEFHEDGHSRDQ